MFSHKVTTSNLRTASKLHQVVGPLDAYSSTRFLANAQTFDASMRIIGILDETSRTVSQTHSIVRLESILFLLEMN